MVGTLRRCQTNHAPVLAKPLDDTREEHGGATLEHAEFGHHPAQVQACGVDKTLVQMYERVRVTVGHAGHQELRQLLGEDRIAKRQMPVASYDHFRRSLDKRQGAQK